MIDYLYFSSFKLFLTLAKIKIYLNNNKTFLAQFFAGLEFDGSHGTVRSTVYVERYGTECGLSLTVRDGVRFWFFYAVRFRIHIFGSVSLSSCNLSTKP